MPSFVAEKRTLSDIVAPAPSRVPSGNAVRALKPTLRAGGFERTNEALRPPELCRTNVESTVAPNGTSPRSNEPGLMLTRAGAATTAVRSTDRLPPSECTVIRLLYCPLGAVLGAVNVTVMSIESPGAIVAPAPGTPPTLNGDAADGRSVVARVSVAPPVFVVVTPPESADPPAVVPPRLSCAGETVSSGVADAPVADSATEIVPADVSACNVPDASPTFVGVNVTGTEMVSPAAIDAGVLGVAPPTVNAPHPSRSRSPLCRRAR